MAKEFKERTITINLRKAFQKPATKRAISAKNMLKAGVEKETRLSDASVSNKVNELIWSRGKYNAPRKLTVKVISEKGRAIILLPSEKYEPKQEKKTDKKGAKKEEEKKETKTTEPQKAEAKTPEKKEPKQKENKTSEKKETAPKAAKEEKK